MQIQSIHHVTAIARDAQANVSFYVGALGLRLVKQTGNFDDSATYHLDYGDHLGTPGSIVTFFPRQTVVTSFRVGKGALNYWTRRFHAVGVSFEGTMERFGAQAPAFADPDGMRLVQCPGNHCTRDDARLERQPADTRLKSRVRATSHRPAISWTLH